MQRHLTECLHESLGICVMVGIVVLYLLLDVQLAFPHDADAAVSRESSEDHGLHVHSSKPQHIIVGNITLLNLQSPPVSEKDLVSIHRKPISVQLGPHSLVSTSEREEDCYSDL